MITRLNNYLNSGKDIEKLFCSALKLLLLLNGNGRDLTTCCIMIVRRCYCSIHLHLGGKKELYTIGRILCPNIANVLYLL